MKSSRTSSSVTVSTSFILLHNKISNISRYILLFCESVHVSNPIGQYFEQCNLLIFYKTSSVYLLSTVFSSLFGYICFDFINVISIIVYQTPNILKVTVINLLQLPVIPNTIILYKITPSFLIKCHYTISGS